MSDGDGMPDLVTAHRRSRAYAIQNSLDGISDSLWIGSAPALSPWVFGYCAGEEIVALEAVKDAIQKFLWLVPELISESNVTTALNLGDQPIEEYPQRDVQINTLLQPTYGLILEVEDHLKKSHAIKWEDEKNYILICDRQGRILFEIEPNRKSRRTNESHS